MRPVPEGFQGDAEMPWGGCDVFYAVDRLGSFDFNLR